MLRSSGTPASPDFDYYINSTNSMGSAWTANSQFPWEVTRWSGGIENVKINVTLRIYSNKWHVYAGLAILNPAAQTQIRQYADSVNELFKLILANKKEEFSARIKAAGEFVFGSQREHELLLRDEILDHFSLSGVPKAERKPNSHLSLLAMVDCWHRCGIVPYDHMICSTPVCPPRSIPNQQFLTKR
jgi:prephenate dehydrogenase (NADP+)